MTSAVCASGAICEFMSLNGQLIRRHVDLGTCSGQGIRIDLEQNLDVTYVGI